MCSKLFLRVPQLCQIFAYRTRHTKCVVIYFFGSLTYVRSSLIEQSKRCVVSYFFGSLNYFRSSLTEQGTRSLYGVISSGRSVMSDLRLQNQALAVCSKFIFGSLTYRHLCQIFAYRTRHTKYVVSYFFGFLIYVRSSLTDAAHAVCRKLFLRVGRLCQISACRTRHRKCVVNCFFGSLSYVRSPLAEQGTGSV